MHSQAFRPGFSRWENHLLALSGLVALISLICIPYTPGPRFVNLPEVIIPLGLSLALSVYTVWLQRRNRNPTQFKRMVKYGWAGALGSAGIGSSWLALHLHYGLPIDVLPDKILTILSVGTVAGVIIGRRTRTDQPADRPIDRVRVVSETSWTNREGSAPIFEAVIDALVELDGVDPLAREPIFDDIDPEIFHRLRTQEDSRWQLSFCTGGYEIRVNSHGAVTVYGDDTRVGPPSTSRAR